MVSDESKDIERGFANTQPGAPGELATKNEQAVREKKTAPDLNEEVHQPQQNERPEQVHKKEERTQKPRSREDWGGYKGY